jgi:energy-coupling factor transporter ATP-binding protein EcfA2
MNRPTGLHLDDVRVLISVLDRLVDAGHTVLVIEHHMDVIKRADWVIDMGPEAGNDGGQVVAQGNPGSGGRGRGIAYGAVSQGSAERASVCLNSGNGNSSPFPFPLYADDEISDQASCTCRNSVARAPMAIRMV